MIITIDGPSGSGKSTVARKLAKKLAFIHLNQGAFFRAAGLKAAKLGVELDRDEELVRLVEETSFAPVLPGNESSGDSSAGNEDTVGILVDGVYFGEELQTPEAGRVASQIAVHPGFRQAILDAQRKAVLGQSVVVEGRDAGSVGFPEADLKVYLDAKLEVRAKRRFAELQSLGERERTYSLETIKQDMAARDKRDTNRSIDPLAIPDGALQIDTTGRSVDEIVEEILIAVKERA